MPVPPPTAYKPGTKLVVGSHDAEIVKFIGEGGFAHVYTVKVTPPLPGRELACLKRVQVPTKAYLDILRAEVGAMQRLRGCSNVVQYIDSHAERMHQPGAQGQYEVFLLMEFCERGGLIDLMNSRLRDQLREHEILKIMYDITLGLARMHYLQPPLLHRDLKIENVLICADGTFKLCDFGSVSPVLRPPRTPQEFKLLDDDIQHHTTVQYRSPEMLDLTRGLPIDEKSDIWALGVFLYKLCFYTTPFERPGQTYEQFKQLVLSGSFNVPLRPAYSDRLKNMICVLLQPDPRMRPNVFQEMQEICAMRHVDCPLVDIYTSNPITPATSAASSNLSVSLPGQLNTSLSNPSIAISASPASAPATNAPPLVTGPLSLHTGPAGAIPHHASAPSAASKLAVAAPPNMQVLALSPGASPLVRPVSPLEEEVKNRYPTLEELDRLNPPLIDLNTPKEQKSEFIDPGDREYRLPPRPSKPIIPAPASQPKRPAPKPNTSANTSANASANAGANAAPKPATPTTATPTTASPSASMSGQTSSPEDFETEEETSGKKLQTFLTGISTRSNTVILDDNDEQRNLSSVEFLRALDTGKSEHKKSRALKSGHKPALSRFYAKKPHKDGYSSDEDDDDGMLDFKKDINPYPANSEDQARSAPTSPRLRPATAANQPTEPAYRQGATELYRAASSAGHAGNAHFDIGSELAYSDTEKAKLKHRHLPKPHLRHHQQQPQPDLDPEEAYARGQMSGFDDLKEDLKPGSKPKLAPKPKLKNLSKVPQHLTKVPQHLTKVPQNLSKVPSKLPKPSMPQLRPKPNADVSAKPSPQQMQRSPTADLVNMSSASSSNDIPPLTLPERPKSVVLPYKQGAKFSPLQWNHTGESETDSVSETSVDMDPSRRLSDGFRPSNAIQQRVYKFLNSQNQQHPPRRTAQGYGRYTDDYAHSESDYANEPR